jgi:hypothetical protein
MTETSRETLQDPSTTEGTTDAPNAETQRADAGGGEVRPDDRRAADAPYDDLRTPGDQGQRGGVATDGDALGSGAHSAEQSGDRLSTADLVDRGNHARDDQARNDQGRDDQARNDQGAGSAAARADDAGGGAGDAETNEPLISDGDAYLSRWQTVQAGFVDDPRSAVQEADALVAEVIQRIAESFARERDQLEQQWSGGQDVGTEDLRVQLQRYRSFFTRLLHT